MEMNNNMGEMHPDRESYEIIWQDVIEREIHNYKLKYVNCIEVIPNIKEEIWKKYEYLNNYCKIIYMKSSEGKIDRHKVAASYMIAIVTSHPMIFVGEIDGQQVDIAINETLAITVGLSLVRAFAIASINSNNELQQKDKAEMISKFEKGIKIPDDNLVNHGIYIQNYANELHFNASEGNISILSIAHELYLLEVITQIKK